MFMRRREHTVTLTGGELTLSPEEKNIGNSVLVEQLLFLK